VQRLPVEFSRGPDPRGAVIAGVARRRRDRRVTGGLLLGLVLWTGSPFVLSTGAAIHEKQRYLRTL
jgi:hypothetical protein